MTKRKPTARRKRSDEEAKTERSGGVDIESDSVTAAGDIVGRDKQVAGEDIVGGDQYKNIGAGATVVGRGGMLTQVRQTIVNLPRSAQIGGGVALLALLVVLVGIALPLLRQTGFIADVPTPTPTLEFPAASPEDFLVLVAEFANIGDRENIVGERLKDQIDDVVRGVARVESVRAKPDSQIEALELGRRYDASIIVWGTYDAEGLFTHVEFLPSAFLQAAGVVGVTGSQDLNEVALDARIREAVVEVAPRVNYLVSYVAGQVHSWRAYGMQLKGQAEGASQESAAAMQFYDQALSAVQDFAASEQADLNVDRVYTVRGVANITLQQYDEAIQDLERAIALNANSARAQYNLGYAYLYGQGDYDKALSHLQAAADAGSGDIASDSYTQIGLINDQQSKTAEAESNYQRALDHNPDNVTALSGMSDVRFKQGSYDEAIRLLAHAIEVNPDDRDPINEMVLHCNLGKNHLANGSPEEAAQAYDAAAAIAAANATGDTAFYVVFYLSGCQDELRQFKETRPELSADIDANLSGLDAVKLQLATPTPEAAP